MRPLVAGILATLIVLAMAAYAGSRVHRVESTSVYGPVEHVMVARPKMELRVAAGTPAPAPAANTAAQIARTAKVSLYVAHLDKAASLVGRIARQSGGDVFSSEITNGDGSADRPSGTMEIRVPAERFDSAMRGVMQSGTVRERSTSAEDLTGSIVDSNARLRNLRRTEADIRAIMDRSGSVSQIMDAENQLSQVREQIETLESELKDMRVRVVYATIDVDMQEEAKTLPVTPTPASELLSAWHDAVASLEGVTLSLAAMLLWIAVFVPYVLAAVAVGWFVYVRSRNAIFSRPAK